MAGITSTKKIKGQPHLLAYITPNEVEKLKALGGQKGYLRILNMITMVIVAQKILKKETNQNLMILM
jgi:hypothetical protein